MSRMENLIAASGPVEERRFSAASGPLLNGALAPVRAAVFCGERALSPHNSVCAFDPDALLTKPHAALLG